jgi:hypothetical protein
MAVIKNQTGGHVGTLDVANATYTLANLAVPNTSIENVTGMGVARIKWTGDWVIKQGANVIFQCAANTVGDWDLQGQSMLLQGANTAANITANTTDTSSTLVMVLTKYAYNTLGVY